MKFWVVCAIVVIAWIATGIAQQAKMETGDICWGVGADRQCAPLSIVKATFQGWQPGMAAPTASYKQDLIALQGQLAETLKNFRQCEGTLGPLQAESHSRLIQQQQQQLNEENVKAAPPGMTWDQKLNRYVPAPPPAPPAATPKKGRDQ